MHLHEAYSLARRFSEPSSYAGIATVLALFGIELPMGEWHAIVQIACLAGSLVAALIAFFKPEAKGK